jgi:cellulose synthase/poly-beta-1,6-N-acetylglucosamine synthase-like glycosyltransferase
MEIALWILIGLVFYTYLGYGILLFCLLKLKRIFKPRQYNFSDAFEPAVTLAIPAFNEEDFILKKAKNCLALDYPKDKLRIVFITDGSTDNTVKLLQEVEGVEVLHEDRRAGKSAAENRVMQFVESPIIVFCDANTLLNKEAIRELVKFYIDPKVGGVSGEKRILQGESETATGAGEGIYWKYESTLKRWDAELYSIVGAAGELVSFRSTLVMTLEEDTILDDFMQSLRICEKGYRMEYEPKAYAMETASEDVGEELKRKIRIAAGGWQSMSRLGKLLNPFRNFTLTFQYVSHRVLRWSISALALPVILLLNLMLVLQGNSLLYQLLFAAQIVFYAMALLGWTLENRKIRVKVLFVPYYFLIMNYAVFAGFFRWIKGAQKAAWERSKRAADLTDFDDL